MEAGSKLVPIVRAPISGVKAAGEPGQPHLRPATQRLSIDRVESFGKVTTPVRLARQGETK